MARAIPVDAEIRGWLRGRVEASSVRIVARQLDMSDTTVMRVLAGLPVQPGTEALLRQSYEGRDAA